MLLVAVASSFVLTGLPAGFHFGSAQAQSATAPIGQAAGSTDSRSIISAYRVVPRTTSNQADESLPAPRIATEPEEGSIRRSKQASPTVDVDPAELNAGSFAPREGRSRRSFWQRCRQNLQKCFIGFPEEFKAPPLGQFVYLFGRTEVANGDAARMTLYHYDFQEGRAALTSRGKDQLAKITGLLPQNFFPIVIERTTDVPELAEARRRVVLGALAKGTFPVPPERVVIGIPTANGLNGVEAEIIYRTLKTQTENGGVISGQPGSLIQGTGVGGFGGATGGTGGSFGGQSGQSQPPIP
jgi:hypothetical protein